jgi:hypothetical protein
MKGALRKGAPFVFAGLLECFHPDILKNPG